MKDLPTGHISLVPVAVTASKFVRETDARKTFGEVHTQIGESNTDRSDRISYHNFQGTGSGKFTWLELIKIFTSYMR